MVYSTDTDSIDDLLFGGFPEKRVSGIFASPNTGKSLLTMQTCMKALVEDKKCLYITSPSEYDSKAISQIFFKRFNTERTPDFIKARTCVDLAKLFNLDMVIDNSKDKTAVTIRNMKKKDIRESTGFVRDQFANYNLIVVDAFSELVKLSIQTAIQNLIARSDIETHLFGAFTDVMEDYDCTFLLTHHSSVNPMAWADVHKPYGGPVLMYLSKNLLLIKKPDKKLYSEVGIMGRRIQRYRWTGSLPSDFLGIVVKKDWGYTDLDDWKERDPESDVDD